MKKLSAVIGLFFCSVALAATTIPPQLISPTGSTAGQAVVSTGASSAPAWGAVSLNGVSGTLPVANGGTGSTAAAGARTNLGLGTSATVNTGTTGATIPLLNGANTWSALQTFGVRPTFNGETPWDSANLPSPTSFPTSLSGYSPTVTATSGSFTSVSTSGRYYVLGKLVWFEATVAITTVGTASGVVNVSLPMATNTSSGATIFVGRETGVTGKTLSALANNNQATAAVSFYDATSAINAGYVLVITGTYVSN